MAEKININVFDENKKFVDLTGLDYFWEKAKAYVDAADKVTADKVTALEGAVGVAATDNTDATGLFKAIADLKTTVDALGEIEGGDGLVGMIDAKINTLDVTDAAVAGQYVSSVSEADGKITVTRAALPDYTETYDAKGAAAAALTDAKTYVDGLVGVYASEGVVATGLRKDISDVATDLSGHKADVVAHITADERTSWNAAKTAIDAFLKDADMTEKAVDTLAELQTYMTTDGEAAAALVGRVGSLESIVGKPAEGDAAATGLVKTVADMDDAYKAADTALETSLKAHVENRLGALGTKDVEGVAVALTVKDYVDGKVDGQFDANGAAADALATAKQYTDELFESFQFAAKSDIDALFA